MQASRGQGSRSLLLTRASQRLAELSPTVHAWGGPAGGSAWDRLGSVNSEPPPAVTPGIEGLQTWRSLRILGRALKMTDLGLHAGTQQLWAKRQACSGPRATSQTPSGTNDSPPQSALRGEPLGCREPPCPRSCPLPGVTASSHRSTWQCEGLAP